MADVLAGALSSLKNTYGPVSDYCGPFQFKQPKRTSNLAGGRAGNLHHGGGYRNLPHELYELSFRRVQRFIHCALPGEFPAYHFLHEGGEV